MQTKEENTEQGTSKQQLILGTHTSEGEQNYLMRAEVSLPLEETETDNRWVGGLCRGMLGLVVPGMLQRRGPAPTPTWDPPPLTAQGL